MKNYAKSKVRKGKVAYRTPSRITSRRRSQQVANRILTKDSHDQPTVKTH